MTNQELPGIDKKEADIDQAFAGLALMLYDLGYAAGYASGRDARNEAR